LDLEKARHHTVDHHLNVENFRVVISDNIILDGYLKYSLIPYYIAFMYVCIYACIRVCWTLVNICIASEEPL